MKLLAPLAAVAVVMAMGLSLLAGSRAAEAAAVNATSSSPLTGRIWNRANIAVGVGPLSLTEPSAAAWNAGDTITLTHAGLTSSAVVGSTCTGCTVAYGAGTTTITVTTVSANVDTVTLSAIAFAQATGAEASYTITAAGGATVATITSNRLVLGWSVATSCASPVLRTTPTFSADPAALGGALCALVADAAGAPVAGLPITFTVSLGVVSTGTSKTAIALTNDNGIASTNYRGGGGIVSTDTAIATNQLQNLVDTLSINLTAPTGTTATSMEILAPSDFAIAPNITNASPGYSSPMIGSNIALRAMGSSSLGVNNQVILVTVDKGAIVANPAFATNNNTICNGVTAKSITLTTSATDVNAPGGTPAAGYADFTVCGNQNDAPGSITVTAQNITTSMANQTRTLTQAGRPAKIETTVTGNQISAKVVDAAGNPVADGTPVWFTLSPNAGAVSSTCTTTSNGVATSFEVVVQSSGSVIVTSDYNESGAAGSAATCLASGTKQVSTTANVNQTGGTGGTGGTGTGPGTFATTPVFSSGGLAQVVWNGGSVAQLDAALRAVGANGAWAQASNGQFRLYIVNGGFMNDQFNQSFPNGFSGVIAMTLVKVS